MIRVTTAVLALLVVGAAPAQADGPVRGGAVRGAGGGVQVGGLTVEHQVDPLGVDDAKPRLGWTLSAQAHGVEQSAYEVAVPCRGAASPASSLKRSALR